MFGARDLALFLPDKAGDLSSLRLTVFEESVDQSKIKESNEKQGKVKRYRKGQAPDWLTNEKVEFVAENVIHSAQDSRLSRLSSLAQTSSTADNDLGKRRKVFEAEIVELPENDDDNESESDNMIIESQPIVRHERSKVFEAQRITQSEPSRHLVESSEEEESEEDEDEAGFQSIVKPVFVRKGQRTTIDAHQRKISEELLQSEKREAEALRQKELTREQVAECIRRNEEPVVDPSLDNLDGRPDDTDEIDDDDDEVRMSVYLTI